MNTSGAIRLARGTVFFAVTAILLTGCAGQRAYQEGTSLAAQGRTEESLAKFREATAHDPAELQFRIAYRQALERTIATAVVQADRAAARGDLPTAEKLYAHVLELEAGNERALAGQRALAASRTAAGAAGKAVAVLPAAAESQLTSREIGMGALAAAYRRPISIEFKDVSLKQVFEVISRSSGLNFIFDKDVRLDQKVTLFLKNTSVEAAVYYTLLTNQLEQQVVNSNTVLVYPNAANKLKDYQEMMVHTFHLTNADAKAVAASLKTLVKTRDIVVDDKLNMLIVRDTPDAIRMASRLVALHDVPEPEVMLEVEILEIKRDRILELGIAWPDSLSLTPLPGASVGAGVLTLRDLRGLNSTKLAAGIGPVTINARSQDSDAKLLANPRIRARNREKAKILIGDRVPLITTTSTATGFASESINYLDVGLKLDIEPSIHLDNDVAIKISLEVSNIVNQLQTRSGSIAYQIGTRTASTVLRLKDGENQVLAGLINDEDRRSARKIPGLGNLPIIGRLFGSTADDHQKTEIVLSITPHLIRNIERPDVGWLEFASGTENSLRMRPDAFAATVGGTVRTLAMTGLLDPAAAAPAISATLSAALTPALKPAQQAEPQAHAGRTGAVPTPPAVSDASPGGSSPPPGAPGAPAGPAEGQTPPAGMNETAASGAPDAFRMQLTGARQIKVGQIFTLQLAMESALPLTSVPLVITFDDKVFEASGIIEGGFLRQGGAPTSFNSKIDPGRILLTGTRTGEQGASGRGTFASVNFKALAPAGSSAVTILTVAPLGLSGIAIAAPEVMPHVVEVKP